MANTKLPARLLDTSAIPALNVTGDLTVDTTTLKVDSTNNRVGIGIASPDGQLHVKGTTNKTLKLDPTFSSGTFTTLAFARNGTDKWRVFHPSDDSYLSFYNDQASAHQLTLKSDGNVGIGTTSPADRLHVALDSSTTNAEVDVMRVEATSSGTPAVGFGPFIDFRGDRINGGPDSYGRLGFEADAMPSTTVDGAFVVQTAEDGTYSERLRIDSSGQLMLGTITGTGIIRAFGSTGRLIIGDTNNNYYDANTHNFRNYSAAIKMIIDSSGNVGIGTTSPNTQLQINSATDPKIRLESNESGSKRLDLWIDGGEAIGYIAADQSASQLAFRTAGAERMRIMANGNVGIGTDTPDRGLTIDRSNQFAAVNVIKNNTGNQIAYLGTGSSGGTDNGILQLSDSGTVKAQIYTTGDSYFNGGNVGIGLASSIFSKLDVRTTDWSSGAPYGTVAYFLGGNVNDNNWGHVLISQSSTSVGSGGKLSFGSNGDNPIAGIKAYYAGATYGHLDFYTRPSGGTATQRMRIASDGALEITSNTAQLAGSFSNSNTDGYGMRITTYSNATQYGLAVDSYGGGYSRDFTVGVDGNVNALTGNVVISTAGKGVFFGGAAGASGMTSQLLDDYEEGTWTPVIQGLGGNAATATTGSATYTKIGRLVYVTAYMHTINLSAITSGSYIVLTGLPFAATGYGDFTIGYRSGGWTDNSTAIAGGYVQNGQSYIYFVRPDGVEPSQGGGYAISKMMLNVCYQAS